MCCNSGKKSSPLLLAPLAALWRTVPHTTAGALRFCVCVCVCLCRCAIFLFLFAKCVKQERECRHSLGGCWTSTNTTHYPKRRCRGGGVFPEES